MFQSCSLMMLALAAGQTGDAQAKSGPQVPLSLHGKVVDIFEGNQLLLSFGKDKGARKGLMGMLVQTEPEPRYLGEVEFVEVGAKHSVVRFKFSFFELNYPRLVQPVPILALMPTKERTRLKEGDSVDWYSIERRPVPYVPRFTPYLPGGAMIERSK